MTDDLIRRYCNWQITDHLAVAQRERERWTTRLGVIGIIAVIIFALGIVGAIDMRVEQDHEAERRARDEGHAAVLAFDAFHRAWTEARERDFDMCPPEDPARPSVIVILVENASDLNQHGPRIASCYRIPEPRRP